MASPKCPPLGHEHRRRRALTRRKIPLSRPYDIRYLKFSLCRNEAPRSMVRRLIETLRKARKMCDYSLQSVRSRPAKVADRLVTCDFGTGTCGFAAPEDSSIAVCVRPGTELSFSAPVRLVERRFYVPFVIESLAHTTAIFRQINKNEPRRHHDALEFPDGRIVLLTTLGPEQQAIVLQLPAQPTSAAEAEALERVAYAG